MFRKYWIVLAILSLSAFTHLYNPVGFPDIFYDEGIYMSRAMHFLDTGDPQESFLYDHPYFGQIILGGVMWITNFPDYVKDTDSESLEQLYLLPRIFMGLVAVLDTFLIYKIADTRYGKNVAIISAVLFAVMPFSWIFKRILLDSLMLPFLLGSVLLALNASQKQNQTLMILLSGILLGLSIFTKIPAFVFVVLIGWIVFYCRKKVYDIGSWLIPVFLIPFMWLVYVIAQNDFDLWFKDVLWHTQRETVGLYIAKYFTDIDPVLFGLGIAGIVYSAYRKDMFVLLWAIPMILFMGTVGFTQYFHWISLIPIFCIAGAIFIVKLLEKIPKHTEKLLVTSIIVLVIFGLASTIPLLVTDMSSSQFQAMSFVLNDIETDNVTILASPVYSWIFDYYGLDNVMLDYSIILFEIPQTDKVLLVADRHYVMDLSRGQELQKLYDETESLIVFENSISEYDTWIYPYGSLKFNMEGSVVDVRLSD